MSEKVKQGPKGGYYIEVKGKKRYLKPEEAKARMGLSPTKKKKISKATKAKGKYSREKLKKWSSEKPKRGEEREKVIKDCGSECFLVPNERKYPVCSKSAGTSGCKLSCNGILAALNRSRMVTGKATKHGDTKLADKHFEVYKKAVSLRNKYKC